VYLNYPTSQGYSAIPGTRLFGSVSFTPADAGRTFTLSSNLDDPDYNNFVDYLTNGIDNQLMFWYLANGSGPGTEEPESQWLSSFLSGTAVDLKGYTINSLSLYVSTLFLSHFYGNPCGISGCTAVSFSGSFIIDGEITSVPLPASLLLFVPGLAGLAAMKRRPKG
jgi:hypothetical protein